MALSLDEEKISKAVSLVLATANKKKEGDMFDGDLPVQIQISVKKIPRDNTKTQLQLKLPHALIKPGDDICLFVKDLDKTQRDTEPTVDFYKELMSKNGIDNVKQIVPVKGLKTDYKPFEARANLSNAYDIYLADERVMSCLPRLLGKSFYGRKRAPTQINVRAKNLQGEINKALQKSRCDFSATGTSSMASVGHSGMSLTDLTANVMAAIDQISAAVPGSSANIRQLGLRAKSCPTFPIYMSAQGGPQDIKFKKPTKKNVKVEIDELSTMPDAKVAVYPDGRVFVLRKGQTLKEAVEQDRKAGKRKRKRDDNDKGNSKGSKKSKPMMSKKKPKSKKTPKKLKTIK